MAIFDKKTEDKEDNKEQTAPVIQFGGALKHVLVKPRISEKSARLAEAGKYVFNVLRKTNKVQVKKAIEAAYKVKVTKVNIINNEGKHRVYGRTSGKMSDFKKAIVTLKKGDKIVTADAV